MTNDERRRDWERFHASIGYTRKIVDGKEVLVRDQDIVEELKRQDQKKKRYDERILDTGL